MLAQTIIFGLFLPLVACIPQAPQPSSQPQCSYMCPPYDEAGWQAVPFMDPSPTEIFCSYPTVPGENPLDFYCIYSKVDGHLVYDHNADLCQGNAACPAFTGRRIRSLKNVGRRSGLPARRPRPPQSEVPSDVRPSLMKTRVALGKGKKQRATNTTKHT